MKSLNTVQKFMKAGKIISLILLIMLAIGLLVSIIGMVALGFDILSVKFGGETLKSIIETMQISDLSRYSPVRYAQS